MTHTHTHTHTHTYARTMVILWRAAKNIVLAGPKSLTIVDHRNATVTDLGTQFFLSEADVGRNRAAVSGERLSELNPCVYHVTSSPTLLQQFWL